MAQMIGSAIVLTAVLMANQTMTREQAISLAQETLRAQIEAAPDSVTVRDATALDWPDTSLGCPQPGMMYAQVITPGYRVLLVVHDKTYSVHVGGGRAVVCVRGAIGARTPKGKAAHATVDLIRRARERLAATLKVNAADVRVDAIRRDGAESKRVLLEYDGRRYVYDAATDAVHLDPAE